MFQKRALRPIPEARRMTPPWWAIALPAEWLQSLRRHPIETEEVVYNLIDKILVRDRKTFEREGKARGTTAQHIAAVMIAEAPRAPGGTERLKPEATLAA